METFMDRCMYHEEAYQPTTEEWREIQKHLKYWNVEDAWVNSILVCERYPGRSEVRMALIYATYPGVDERVSGFKLCFTFGEEPNPLNWCWEKFRF